MNIKNERGITLTMLIITIIVMLIIATVLVYFSVGDNSLMNNARTATFKEDMSTLKSKVDDKVITKQNIEGKTSGVTLTIEEQKEILGDYYTTGNLKVDDNGNLIYTNNSNFSDSQKEILESIGISGE
ncbi:MAG: hypothetical protein ACI4VN_05390 [Clostridia bacterium]|nr:hypothetical protein [Clostridia bacterium]